MIKTHRASMCRKFERTLKFIGQKWNCLIIDALLPGPLRFCQLRDSINGISDRVLIERLRDFQQKGLITKGEIQDEEGHSYSTYQLTEKGRALEPCLTELHHWADQWIELN